jgi:hypothetical protein
MYNHYKELIERVNKLLEHPWLKPPHAYYFSTPLKIRILLEDLKDYVDQNPNDQTNSSTKASIAPIADADTKTSYSVNPGELVNATVVDQVIAWVRGGNEGEVPKSLSEAFDAWLEKLRDVDNDKELSNISHGGTQGNLILFESLPKRRNLGPSAVDFYLEGCVPQERRDQVWAGASLSRYEEQAVMFRWMRQHFKDPNLSGITGYQIHELIAGDAAQCSVVTFWTGNHVYKGHLAAAFRAASSARDWLRQQGIVDQEWIANEAAAVSRALGEHRF